jgi:4-hydroxybenzoate polyprenyltransferase
MLDTLRGFSGFISIERGFMLCAISIAATFLLAGKFAWQEATYVGLLVFCGWSAVDAINNVCDADLDTKSDAFRAQYTKSLGRSGLMLCLIFFALTLGLGIATLSPLVVTFILLAGVAGLLYSVPPFRLRQTIYKPVVNFFVGAFPILIAAAFASHFSANAWTLVFLFGLATAGYSLWGDLADYASDLDSGGRTIPIVLGLKRGLCTTIVSGYSLFPLMALVGVMFQLNILYYLVLFSLAAYLSIRVILKRSLLLSSPTNDDAIEGLGQTLAKVFVIIAIVQTTNLMLSAFLKLQGFSFWVV